MQIDKKDFVRKRHKAHGKGFEKERWVVEKYFQQKGEILKIFLCEKWGKIGFFTTKGTKENHKRHKEFMHGLQTTNEAQAKTA